MQRQSDNTVLCERDGPIATVSINRPESRNSLTVATAKALYSVLLELSRDTSLKTVILRGHGKDFCCGADIKAGTAQSQADSERLIQDPDPYAVTLLLHTMPAVTIAAIRGGCAGAAIGWACACDIRLATETAKFNTAFLDVGVAGDMGGPWFLTRMVGAARARDLYFFPRKFSGQEAYDMGMVTRITTDDEFENALTEMTARFASAAPLALRSMKANFVDAERMDLPAYIHIETERHIRLYTSLDRQEAFKAFLEKRPPRFEGR